MSSGDIDDVLADQADWIQILSSNDDLRSYLHTAWQLSPIRLFFIPFGAGMNEDGTRVYISHDIQTVIDDIECAPALVRHETTEWGLRKFAGIGLDYLNDPTGHRLANRAEHDLVQVLLGDDGWERYSEIIDPQVLNSERTNLKDKPTPKDLALYPYEDEEIENLLEAMSNKRSEEEWLKLQKRRSV
jgi:hypothetical protein